ncbi:hypothetical protein MUK42_14615 [Musa troglodytarum]|uniref:Uncharacterized protein n=1 Tax=Musa troglodytarum TaxID=320322 RepID=A0A9E7L651_9LILI|nr:hypothetical protein MUK42_14615 [Musa troglodytarum]
MDHSFLLLVSDKVHCPLLVVHPWSHFHQEASSPHPSRMPERISTTCIRGEGEEQNPSVKKGTMAISSSSPSLTQSEEDLPWQMQRVKEPKKSRQTTGSSSGNQSKCKGEILMHGCNFDES